MHSAQRSSEQAEEQNERNVRDRTENIGRWLVLVCVRESRTQIRTMNAMFSNELGCNRLGKGSLNQSAFDSNTKFLHFSLLKFVWMKPRRTCERLKCLLLNLSVINLQLNRPFRQIYFKPTLTAWKSKEIQVHSVEIPVLYSFIVDSTEVNIFIVKWASCINTFKSNSERIAYFKP